MRIVFRIFLGFVCAVPWLSPVLLADRADPRSPSHYQLPLVFEPSAESDSRYVAHAGKVSLQLMSGQVVLGIAGQTPIAMSWSGGNARVGPRGEQSRTSYSNYYTGNDPRRWRRNVAHYGAVRYRQAYPGIDLVFHGAERQLEYDFILAPGADAGSIRLNFTGARQMRIEKNELVLTTQEGSVLRQQTPVVYQDLDGQRRPIAGRYVQHLNGEVGFVVGDYDRAKPLVIDPVLNYATYAGGSGEEYGHAVAVDANGNIYVAGSTASSNFPAWRYKLSLDAFVAKFDATGAVLQYKSYFGGGYDDEVQAVAVDSAGNAYVTGTTRSLNFPATSGAYRTTTIPDIFGYANDSFAAKLNAQGQLVYSTYLSGNGSNPQACAIAVDASGQVYIAGTVMPLSGNAPAYPTTSGAYMTAGTGTPDGFITMLNANGTGVQYSTLLGGAIDDHIYGLSLLPDGTVVVAGATGNAQLFPTTAGAYQRSNTPYGDAFVAKLNNTGSALIFSTLLGGSGNDQAYAVATDSGANIYVTGATQSTDFPTTNGVYQGSAGSAFVSKLDPTGSQLLYSTYVLPPNDLSCSLYPLRGCNAGSAIAVDGQGAAYVTGTTSRADFPVTPGALQPQLNSISVPRNTDAFLLRLNPSGTATTYATYYGGSADDVGEAIAVDGGGNVYLAGSTLSLDLPITPNAVQPTAGQPAIGERGMPSHDAFVARISMQAASCSFSLSQASLILPASAVGGTISVTATPGCPWSAFIGSSQTSPWFSFAPLSGVGSGVVTYAASDNFSIAARGLTLVVGGQAVPILQAAMPCTYSIQPAPLDLPVSGGASSLQVSAPSGCTWPVSSNAPWVSITNVADESYMFRNDGGVGSGQINLSVQPNGTADPRTATLSVAGQTLVVTQPRAGCTFSLSAPGGAIAKSGGSGNVQLVTQAGCTWNAVSSSPWLTPTVTSGEGSTTIAYASVANPINVLRTAKLTIAGLTYTVTQAGSGGATPVVTSVSPAAGTSASQVFTLQISDADSYADLDVVNLLINNFLDARHACYLAYARSSNVLYLVADSGDATQLTGKVMDGTGTIANSQCQIALATSSAVASGAILTLKLDITFSSSFTGDKVMYAAARDQAQHNSGWQTIGVHSVPVTTITYPRAVSVAASSGSGSAALFTFTFRDATRWDNLQTGWVVINSSLDARRACAFAYYRPGNQIYLRPDNGDGASSMIMSLSGTNYVGNSQCVISAENYSVWWDQATLNVRLTIVFNSPSFSGSKAIWMAAQTMSGVSGDWQALGAWNIP